MRLGQLVLELCDDAIEEGSLLLLVAGLRLGLLLALLHLQLQGLQLVSQGLQLVLLGLLGHLVLLPLAGLLLRYGQQLLLQLADLLPKLRGLPRQPIEFLQGVLQRLFQGR
jgi:hypothetical protein